MGINPYIHQRPAMPTEVYLAGAVVGYLALSPLASLALRRVTVAYCLKREALALATAVGLVALTAVDPYDRIAFQLQAYLLTPKNSERCIQYWRQAAELRCDQLGYSDAARNTPRYRAAMVRSSYFDYVLNNEGYCLTLQEVFRTQSVAEYVSQGKGQGTLPAADPQIGGIKLA